MSISYNNNIYTVNLKFNNNHIYLKNLLNNNLFSLFYEINKNIIDSFEIIKIDEQKCKIFLILKHLFKDLGISQTYLFLIVNHDIDNNCFIIETQQYQQEMEKYNVLNMDQLKPQILIKYIVNNDFNYDIHVNISNIIIQEKYLQNLIGNIIIKLFNNLKIFINNYTPNNEECYKNNN